MSRQMKLRPKKRFGQHFLRDTGILNRLVERLNPGPGDLFLEVGAGSGALSERLAARGATLVAVEVDGDQIPQLITALSPFPSAVVEHADILTLDVEKTVSPYLADGRRLRIAGNLPYNIATAIIERLFELRLPVVDMTFLLQLEVAQRITSMPRRRHYGYFSVLCQHLSEVEIGFRIRPGVFYPPPKVMSAVVTLRPRCETSDRQFVKVLLWLAKAAFAHRRKTIANSMRFHPELASISEPLLSKAGIRGGRRAEELTVQEYACLARVCLDNLPHAGANKI